MHNIKPDYLLRALRERIKESHLTYAQLAQQLDVPLSTLKRHLHSTAISLDKLIEYCRVVELSLDELIKQAKLLQSQSDDLFTEIQDEVFFQFPELYDFFQELRLAPESLDKMVAAYELTPTSTYAYLRALEMIGLIELMPNNKFFLKGPCHYRFSEQSKLSYLFNQKLKQLVFENDSEKANIACSRMFLTKKCIQEIEDMVIRKILESNTEHWLQAHETEQLQHDVLLMIRPHKKILFSAGIANLPNEFLAHVSSSIEAFGVPESPDSSHT
ncbi:MULTISPECIES: helix-turn-helix transcriptional regulator [unclassified Motilimonas]|uniref:helix-turn-helix domain-containing protein n=1 Tax=Motilimonas TaxID=1914248 RepID=UPI001E65338F|nr:MULTISPECIES: helix-turn-helix transcriptional regulator [unclassified Motilimonas]MCE0557677.1 helix-turn-helix domain-containing protein [Motilimonas sp. E26]MDO6527195.1 helix-turn-helix transcriptional regulator [Motilimonas sp. 1_MG-2023]